MLGKISRIAIGLLVLIIFLDVLKIVSLFVIDEREQAVITRFNKPVRVIVGNISNRPIEELKASIMKSASETEAGSDLDVSQGAGIYFKLPFIDRVQIFRTSFSRRMRRRVTSCWPTRRS